MPIITTAPTIPIINGHLVGRASSEGKVMEKIRNFLVGLVA